MGSLFVKSDCGLLLLSTFEFNGFLQLSRCSACLRRFSPTCTGIEPFAINGTGFYFGASQLSSLSPSQQCESTEGNTKHWPKPVAWSHHFHIRHLTPVPRFRSSSSCNCHVVLQWLYVHRACRDCNILTLGTYDKKPTYGSNSPRVSIFIFTHADIAAGVCLFVCPRSKRKTAWAINTKRGTRML